jgi:hypothetical protein
MPCPACRRGCSPQPRARTSAAEAEHVGAVRRHYGVPAGRASFLHLADVRARAAQEADEPLAIPTIHSTREIPLMRIHTSDAGSVHAATSSVSLASRGDGRRKIAAAVAITALFAVILYAAAPGSSGPDRGDAPTATATPRALHYLGANGIWETRSQVHTGDRGTATAAPTDLKVLYKSPADGTLGLQRSPDGGKT